MVDRNPDSDDELNMNCMYVCLGFNDTFSTNRQAISHHNSRIIYHVGAGDNTYIIKQLSNTVN